MDGAKIREVLDIYRKEFKKQKISKKEFPHFSLLPTREQALAHCYTMFDKMEVFLTEGRIAKTFRWLGFIQGVLWVLGVYTLEQLKNHNRP